MSYMALYRKWRPSEFEQVKGQEHIVTALRNQIKYDRIGHAYLFCGTRGTGKTTVAKILAKTVNCEAPVDGGPCEQCASCRAISEGRSMNVIEIDAASNNGVDNIREIREEVAYSPTEGKYKVYIIDEVHMLSTGAFNALLKTLEEPPSYVIFILATTEANKIPITILSRCQRYDFRRISIDTITARLSELMEAENIAVEERALRYVAKAADGSMRDALSLLDQCIAFYLGKELTYDNVLEVLGAVDTAVFSKMLGHIVACNTVGAIELLDEIVMQGRELGQFVTDLTWYLRNLLLVKSSEDAMEVVAVSKDNYEQLVLEANELEEAVIMRYIRVLSELSNKIKFETQKRVLVEIALIKLMNPATERDYESLINRIAVVEKKLEEGYVPSGSMPVASVSAQAMAAPKQVVKKEPIPPLDEDETALMKCWDRVVNRFSGAEKACIAEARVSKSSEAFLLVHDGEAAELYFGVLDEKELTERIADYAEEYVGKRFIFKFITLTEQKFDDVYEDAFKMVNGDIEVENNEDINEEDLF